MFVKEGSPDFSFLVLENSSKPNVISFRYENTNTEDNIISSRRKSKSYRLKANGAIWTPLEINNLMCESLNIIAPMGNLEEVSPASSISDGGGAYSGYNVDIDNYYPSGVWFSPDFPDFLLPKEKQSYPTPPQVPRNVITWGVVRMEPGAVSGTPFRGTQERVPRRRECIAVFNDDIKQYIIENTTSQIQRHGKLHQFLTISGQTYDLLLQYNIWSKSNYEVELLTHWFLNYLRDYRGMFREAGVNNMFLWNRTRDETMVQMTNGYHVRSVLYYFRTEEIIIDSVGPINSIKLNIDVDSFLPDEKAKEILTYTESQKQILEKWTKYT